MRIFWQDEDLGEWSGKPRLKEQRRIKDELQMGPNEFLEAVGNDDPYAVSMFIAIMKSRKEGAPVYLEDVDGEPDDLRTVLSEREKAEAQRRIEEIESKLGKEIADQLRAKISTDVSPTSTEPSSDTPSTSGDSTA